MARPLRIEYPGAFYHVMNRGLERRQVFTDSSEYREFLGLLAYVHQRYQLKVHSYCLMPNHYHLYVETPEGNLSKVMKHIDGVYTQKFNRKHARNGSLFQGRYKAILVEKESYSLEISRYIHLNPVKAKLAEKTEEWEWSSYGIFIGKKKKETYVETDWILSQFSQKREESRRLYRQFTLNGIENHWDPYQEIRGKSLLGGEGFIEWIGEQFLSERKEEEIPDIRVLRERSAEELLKQVERLTKEVGLRKKLSIYALHEKSGLNLKEIGELMGGMGYKGVYQTVYRLKAMAREDQKIAHLLQVVNQL